MIAAASVTSYNNTLLSPNSRLTNTGFPRGNIPRFYLIHSEFGYNDLGYALVVEANRSERGVVTPCPPTVILGFRVPPSV